MGAVVECPGATKLDIDPNRVLDAAGAIALDTVLVIGRYTNGVLYFASSTSHLGDVTLLLRRADHYLDRLITSEG